MSQDLFAAFGDPAPSTAGNFDHPSNDTPGTAPLQFLTAHDQGLAELGADHSFHRPAEEDGDEDDDDFGDFEDASVSKTVSEPDSIPQKPIQAKSSIPPKSVAIFPPKAKAQKPVSSKSPISSNPVATLPPKALAQKPVGKAAETPESKIGRHPFADHMDFLFAGDDDDYDAGADDLVTDLANDPEAAMAYSKRVIAEQEAAQARSSPKSGRLPFSSPPTDTRSNKAVVPEPASKRVKDPNVLFDIDDPIDDDDENDFGDFEDGGMSAETTGPPKGTQPARLMPQIDLLGMSDEQSSQRSSANTNSFTASKSASKLSPASTKAVSKPSPLSRGTVSKPVPAPAAQSDSWGGEDEGWDDFEESLPAETPSSTPSTQILRNMPMPQTPSTHSTSQPSRNAPEDQQPPTNIPPPSMLLSIFPALFTSAHETLFEPLSKLDPASRPDLVSHPATHQFLQTHLHQAAVLAHIIAGRKLRWKRDQILAQGMRIGPAAAKSGMKLAGIDRAEVAQEDREVLDALRVWKSQLGRLRAAVSAVRSHAATSSAVRLPHVPDMAEQMPVRTLKAAEGGFTAPHACGLCGLRREERVAKVDIDVDDSFGEWWVQGMHMHLLCRDFWESQKGRLRSR